MGDRCQSRYKFVPEVPEAVRTAQVWHLRYQGDFMQPSVVTVLRERASDFAHKPERKTRSPDRRVQVAPDSSPRAPDGLGGQNRSPRNASQHANHPDIRPGEALVCKTSNGQVTYWAQSKLVSGCEQWRQLAALPPKPPPGGRGGGGGGRRPRQGILSPVPRKGVQFEDKRTRAELPTSETFDAALDVAANEVPPPCLHETYLPQIQHSFQQRRMQRIRSA